MNQAVTENDYSLLRPFNMEDVRAGALLTSMMIFLPGKPIWKYAAGPDAAGKIMVTKLSDNKFIGTPTDTSCLRIAPLCWVKGKPVYKGDKLWYCNSTSPRRTPNLCISVIGLLGFSEAALEGTVLTASGTVLQAGDLTWSPIENWTWEKPEVRKVKKEGWINIYPDPSVLTCRYNSKEEAEKHACIGCIRTIRIEWDE